MTGGQSGEGRCGRAGARGTEGEAVQGRIQLGPEGLFRVEV